MARQDLSERIRGGSPVVVTLTVDDAGVLASHREFLDGLRGDDQRKLYEEMGRPARVDRTELAMSTASSG